MKCPNCGAENLPGAKFCSSCAQPLPAAAATPPPAGPPPAGPPAATPPPATPPPPAAAPTTPMAATGATGAPPPATPAPVAAPPAGGPPKKGMSAGLIGGIAFGVVLVIGALVWFLFLKPDAKQCDPSQPTCVADGPVNPPQPPPPPGPPGPPPPPPPPGPPPPPPPPGPPPPPPPPGPPPPPPPPPPGGGGTNNSIEVCDSVAEGQCTGPGFTKPAGQPFTVLARTTTEGPAKAKMEYLSPDTGQPLTTPTEWDLPDAGKWYMTQGFNGLKAGTKIELKFSVNGVAVDFGSPQIITIQ
jgi:zinc ribbon protein